MDPISKDLVSDVDPLDTLTQEQKTDLQSKVTGNLNAFLQSGDTRPGSSAWSGYEVFKENEYDPLFARMAWEIVNQNFESKLSDQDPLIVDNVYVYLCDFSTKREAGFETLSRTDLWIKQGRKNLVEYLLKIFPTYDITVDNKAETFLHLAGYAIADMNFFGGKPDKSDLRSGRQYMDTSISKVYTKLQQIREMV